MFCYLCRKSMHIPTVIKQLKSNHCGWCRQRWLGRGWMLMSANKLSNMLLYLRIWPDFHCQSLIQSPVNREVFVRCLMFMWLETWNTAAWKSPHPELDVRGNWPQSEYGNMGQSVWSGSAWLCYRGVALMGGLKRGSGFFCFVYFFAVGYFQNIACFCLPTPAFVVFHLLSKI